MLRFPYSKYMYIKNDNRKPLFIDSFKSNSSDGVKE